MFLKLAFTKFFNPDTGASGAAGGAASGAPASGAGAAPGGAGAPAGGGDAGAEPPAWFKQYTQTLDQRFAALEGGKTKAEAEKNAAEQKAMTHEQRFAAQERELASIRAGANNDRIDGALGKLSSTVQFASSVHGDQALKAFRADHKLEVKDGSVLATGPDGKILPVANAFSTWTASPAGQLYTASAVQPGTGAPRGAAPINGGQGAAKHYAPNDLSPEAREYWKGIREAGVTGPLTPGGPDVTIKRAVNPYEKTRNERIAWAMKNSAGANGK